MSIKIFNFTLFLIYFTLKNRISKCSADVPIGNRSGDVPISTENKIRIDELFYEIGFRLNKAGVNPDDMELDEVYWILKKINEEIGDSKCPMM